MAKRGGKRGSRRSIKPESTADEASGYEDEEPAVTYAHNVSLERAPPPGIVEVIGARRGADMPDVLEMATWVMRFQVADVWEKIQGGGLTTKERGEFNQTIDALTKLDRSVRQWRKLEAEELGGLSEDELRELVPLALAAMQEEASDDDDE